MGLFRELALLQGKVMRLARIRKGVSTTTYAGYGQVLLDCCSAILRNAKALLAQLSAVYAA